jgi:hypothetical protein|tara:strand:- start:4077 stop:4298 length:222 start_codon:yes stop_codon:yes gene_type:complete
MEKDFNLRNIVWLSMILVSAGSVYGMLSQRVTALESKQVMMEKAILEDIPEIKERIIRLETKIEILIDEFKTN